MKPTQFSSCARISANATWLRERIAPLECQGHRDNNRRSKFLSPPGVPPGFSCGEADDVVWVDPGERHGRRMIEGLLGKN